MAAPVIVRWIEDGRLHVGSAADLDRAKAGGETVWVDVREPDAEILAVLQKAFGLHPLAMEDCTHFPQRVKIDLYPEAAFIVWVFPQPGPEDAFHAVEVDVFLGDRFLITSHREDVPVIDEVGADAADALARGADWLLHQLLDRGVDRIFPLVDGLSDRLDDIENVLLDDPAQTDLQQLYAIKRSLVQLYRIVGGERDVLRSLSRRERLISQDAYLYFQDVGDHLARVVDTIDTYRDVASGAMDIYLSAVNNRLNDVMKRLTVVATIFMPLTLISGIYGMNVTVGMWPPITERWSFWVVAGSMVAIVAGMLTYFKRRHWW
ncbi:MAG TPA: magnesium/cobalt transporter CorA [Coriobacteriia bacterium]